MVVVVVVTHNSLFCLGTSEVTSDEDHEKKCIRNVMIYSVKVDHEELIPLREMCGKQPKFAMLNTNEVVCSVKW